MGDKKELERILFIAPEMEARGTNEYVTYLADELRKQGFQTAVFCAPGPMLAVLQEKGINAVTFKHLAGFRFPAAQRAGFMENLIHFSPDIVHVPSLSALKSYTGVAADYDAPIVCTVHSAPSRIRHFKPLSSRLSGVIVTSQKVREEIVNDLKFPKSKIAMISNGIDVEAVNPVEAPPAFSNPVPVIGSVGPVERARGHKLFVHAAAILSGSGRTVQFIIAGEGEEVSALSKLASGLGLDRCLTFVRDFASYHEVLGALDVVVQSSQVDVSGFSILDAMGAGRPVVAFNTGTACEIISDGKTGVIVPEVDAGALAEVLLKLVDNPEWARRLGADAYESVKDNFNIRKNAKEIINFYRSILSGHV